MAHGELVAPAEALAGLAVVGVLAFVPAVEAVEELLVGGVPPEGADFVEQRQDPLGETSNEMFVRITPIYTQSTELPRHKSFEG